MPTLDLLIRNFSRTQFGRGIKADPVFECVTTTRQFLSYCAERGLRGEGIQCEGAILPLTTPDWELADRDDVWHCIALIGGVYVDFTRHQFCESLFPTIYSTRAEVKKDWKHVRKFKLDF